MFSDFGLGAEDFAEGVSEVMRGSATPALDVTLLIRDFCLPESRNTTVNFMSEEAICLASSVNFPTETPKRPSPQTPTAHRIQAAWSR